MSVLEKTIDMGTQLIFLGLRFFIFLFLGVWKNLSYFLGLKIFQLFFWGNNFDTIYFWGVWLNDLDLQNRSLKSDQILEHKTLNSNSQGRMDPAPTWHMHKGLIFWVWHFHEFIFLGLIFPSIYFLGIPKNSSAEPSCHVHVRVHSLWSISFDKDSFWSLINVLFIFVNELKFLARQ